MYLKKWTVNQKICPYRLPKICSITAEKETKKKEKNPLRANQSNK